MSNCNETNGRILLFPFPYQGHINPMMDLASLLHSLNFSISIFHSQFNSIDATKYPLFDFILVKEKGISEPFNVDDTPRQIIGFNDRHDESFSICLRKVLSESKEKVRCLILDMHWYKMQAVGKRLGVGTLVLRTGNAASTSWFMAFPLLIKKGYLPIQGDQ